MFHRYLDAAKGANLPLTFGQFMSLLTQMDPPTKPAKMLTTKAVRYFSPDEDDGGNYNYGVPTAEELGECNKKI